MSRFDFCAAGAGGCCGGDGLTRANRDLFPRMNNSKGCPSSYNWCVEGNTTAGSYSTEYTRLYYTPFSPHDGTIENNPRILGTFSPITLKRELENRGFEVTPLSKGRYKAVDFEHGGGI